MKIKSISKSRRVFAKHSLAALPLCISSALSSMAYAGPEGGEVKGGAGSISSNGNTTTINQQTDRMAIDWQSYDVNVNERVQYIQPGSSSISLNRILSNGGSQIHGRIDANGQVILVNKHGIMFGKDSVVNAGGILASGLSIDPDQFMNGDFTFNAIEGTEGAITTRGALNVAPGGSVTLLGQSVVNEGIISAELGSVNFAAGREAVVTVSDSGLVGVRVSEALLEDGMGVDPSILNSGEINAEGGKVLLTASTTRHIFSDVVNTSDLDYGRSVLVNDDGSFELGAGSIVTNTGSIDVSGDQGGAVVLVGENISQTGTIRADSYTADAGGMVEIHSRDTSVLSEDSVVSASAENGVGGDVKVLGDRVGVFDDATVLANGDSGGGQVLIGGDKRGENNLVPNASAVYVSEHSEVSANATQNGDGGKVVLWGDDYLVARGELNAQGVGDGAGGFIETSSAVVNLDPTVNVSGGDGKQNGQWLIDPYNITIGSDTPQVDPPSAGGGFDAVFTPTQDDSFLSVITLRDALVGGSNVLVETAGGGTQEGNITVDTEISFDDRGAASLTLQADNNIFVNQNIIDDSSFGSDSLNLTLSANHSGNAQPGGGNISIASGVSIETEGGTFTASGVNFENLGTINTRSSSGGGDISLTMTGNVTQLGAINLGDTTGDNNAITSNFTVSANDIFIGDNIRDGQSNSSDDHQTNIVFNALGNITFDDMSLDNSAGDNITNLTLNADTDNSDSGDVVLQNSVSLWLNGGDFLATGHNVTLSAVGGGSVNRIGTEGGALSIGTTSNPLSGNFSNNFSNTEFHTYRNQDRTGNVSIYADGNVDIGSTTSSAGGAAAWNYNEGNNFSFLVDAGGNVTINDALQVDRFTGTGANAFSFDADGSLTIAADIIHAIDTSAMSFFAGSGGFINNAAIDTNGSDVSVGDADTASVTFNANIDSRALGVTTNNGTIQDTGSAVITLSNNLVLAAGSGGDITLDNAGLMIGGRTRIDSGNNVTIVNNDDIAILASTVSGDLSLTALGDSEILDFSVISVAGTSTFVAEDNVIEFTNTNSDFGGAVSATGSRFLFNDVNDLVLGNIGLTNPDADNTIDAGGAITQTAGGLITNGGDLSLTGTSIQTNAIDTVGGVGESGGFVDFIASAAGVTTGNITTNGGDVNLSGATIQTSDINAVGGADLVGGTVDLLASTGAVTTGNIATNGSDVNLTGTGIQTNAIDTEGGANQDGGMVDLLASAGSVTTGSISTSGGLADEPVGGSVRGLNAGNVTVTATGDIDVGSIVAVGSAPADDNVDGTSNSDAGVGGNVTLTSSGSNVIVGTMITDGGNGFSAVGGVDDRGDDASGGNAGNILLSANGGLGRISLSDNISLRGGHLFDPQDPAVGPSHGAGGNIALTGDVVLDDNIVIDSTLQAPLDSSNAGFASYTPGFVTITGALSAGADAAAESLTIDAGVLTLGAISTAAIASGANGGEVDITGTQITVGEINTSGRDGATVLANGGSGATLSVTVTNAGEASLVITGDINTEGGSGAIPGSAGGALLTLSDGATSGRLDLTDAGIFTSNVTLVGSDSGQDVLLGPSNSTTPVFWETDSPTGRFASTTINPGVATFSGFETLVGGDGADTFTLNAAIGRVEGGAGDDTFNIVAGVVASIFGDGGTANTVNLVNASGTHDWEITGDSEGDLASGASFMGIQNLNGSDGGIDRFRLTEDFGAGNSIDARGSLDDSLIVTQTGTQIFGFGSAIGGIANLETITAEGDANDFVLQLAEGSTDNTWTIDALNEGSISSPDSATDINFINFSTLVGNDNDDTFVIENGASVARINAQGGDDAVDFSASGTAISVMVDENLGAIDPAFIRVTDIETLQAPAGTLAAPLNNILSMTSASGSEYTWTFFDPDSELGMLTDGVRDGQIQRDDIAASPITFIDFDTFNGGASQDTFALNVAGSSATINGGGNNDTLESFAGASENIWVIDEVNGGELNYTASAITSTVNFSSIENIVGADAAPDTFSFSDDGDLDGSVSAGEAEGIIDTVDYSGSTEQRMITVGGDVEGVSGVERIVGNSSVTNTLTGNATFYVWDITTDNSGEVFNADRSDSIIFENFNTLIGSGANDEFSLLGGSIDNIQGGSGSNRIFGGALGRNWWLEDNANRRVETAGVNTVDVFSGIQTLVGSDSGADTFQITADNNFDGSIVGGTGAGDQLIVETSAGVDTNWTLADDANTSVSRANSAESAGFTGVESIQGGSGADIFSFQNTFTNSALSIDGTDAGDGDTVDVSALNVTTDTLALNVVDTNNAVQLERNGSALATVNNVERVVGASQNNLTLQANIVRAGTALYNTWNIQSVDGSDGVNDGTVAFNNTSGGTRTVTFENIVNLLGSDGTDTFTIATDGSFIGTIDGAGVGAGEQNSLSYDANNLTWQLGTTAFTGSVAALDFSNIQSVTGNNTNSTLVGRAQNNLWDIIGSNSGSVGLDDLAAADTMSFAGMSSLSGNIARDRFVLGTAGSISGTILGTVPGSTDNADDSLSVASDISDSVAWSINSSSSVTIGATNRVDVFAGIEDLTGGAGNDVFTINALSASFTIDGANNDVVSAAPSGDQVIWNVGTTGADYLISDTEQRVRELGNSSGPVVDFSNIEVAYGNNAGDDTFTIRGGNVAQVRGRDGVDTVNIDTTEKDDINIAVFGGNGASDVLVAGNRDNTWLIGGADDNTNSLNYIDEDNRGVVFVGDFETLRGNNGNDEFILRSGNIGNLDGGAGLGNDTLEVQRAATAGGQSQWLIDGINSGSVTGQVSSFTEIENLLGGEGVDTFEFTDIAASISGLISAGEVANFATDPLVEDTLDVSIFTDGVVVELGPVAAAGSLVDGTEDLPNINADQFERVTAAQASPSNDFDDQNDQWLAIASDRDLRWVLDDVPTTNLNQGSVEELDIDGETPLPDMITVFENFGSLQGGDGVDDENIQDGGGNLSGEFRPGAGGRRLRWSGFEGLLVAELSTDVIALEGNGNTFVRIPMAAEVSLNGDNEWIIDGDNQVTFNADYADYTLSFTGVNQLQGGSGQDIFTFTNGADATGAPSSGNLIDGFISSGGGDTDRVNVTNATQDLVLGLSRLLDTPEPGPFGETFPDVLTAPVFLADNQNGVVDLVGITRVDVAHIDPLSPLQTTTITSGESGNYRFDINAADTFSTLTNTDTFTSLDFSGTSRVLGGGADDTFVLTDSSFVNGVLDGGEGRNTVDLSDQNTVNVALGNTAGVYANIDEFVGNGINSVIRGDDVRNTWTIDGVNTGRVVDNAGEQVDFSDFNVLEGGDVKDIFTVNAGGIRDGIFGGLGDDDLIVDLGFAQSVGDPLTSGASGELDFHGNEGVNTATLNGGSERARFIASYSVSDISTSPEQRFDYTINQDSINQSSDVILHDVGTITDNVFTSILNVSGVAAQADTITLGTNRFAVNGLNDVTSRNNRSLSVLGEAQDTVVIDGLVNIDGAFRVSNATVKSSGENARIEADESVTFASTSSVGSSTNRLSVETTQLFLDASRGDTFLDIFGDVDIAQLSSPAGLVDIDASGSITDSAALTSINALRLTSDDSIVLDNINTLSGTLDLAAGGDVILNNGVTRLGDVSAQNLTLTTRSSIEDSGVITIANTATINAESTSAVVLDGALNEFNIVTVNGAGSALINDSSDDGVTVGGSTNDSFSVTANNTVVANAINANVISLTSANGAIATQDVLSAQNSVSLVGNGVTVNDTISVSAGASNTAIVIDAGASSDTNDAVATIAGSLLANETALGDIEVSGGRITQAVGADIRGRNITLNSEDDVVLGANINASDTFTVDAASNITMNNGANANQTQAGTILFNANDDILARALTADRLTLTSIEGDVTQQADITVGTTAVSALNGEFESISGSTLTLAAGESTLAAQSAQLNGDIEGDGTLIMTIGNDLTQVGDITVAGLTSIVGGEISMAPDSVITSTGDVNLTAGLNIALSQINAAEGTVLLNTGAAILDNNSAATNVNADALTIRAESGIGGAALDGSESIETSVTSLDVTNNSGGIGMINDGDLDITALIANSNIFFENTNGNVVLVNADPNADPAPGSYDRTATDAREAGGVVNANYNSGIVTLVIPNGYLDATPGAFNERPELVGDLVDVTTSAGFGIPPRRLVVFARTQTIVSGPGIEPFWGFNIPPLLGLETDTDLLDLSFVANVAELLVRVEDIEDVNPAVFTNVRNFSLDDIAIRLPRDQLYDDEDEEAALDDNLSHVSY